MNKFAYTFLFLLGVAFFTNAQEAKPNFETIYKREIPSWFNEDKFGIFVVWGPYSVPAYKDSGYAEWYWHYSKNHKNTKEFHDRVYGEEFQYEQFAELFKAELWDPDFWCDLFQKSGAKYVVTTANYHDGFAMYPSKFSKTVNTDQWNSTVIGPKRDIIGELKSAGEKKGLKMGIYYSVYEWFHPLWQSDKEKFVTEQLHPKFKEVVTKYEPWFIFLDGEWEKSYEFWKTEELANWLYTESSCKDYVVVNDRWGKCRGIFGDIYESEYGAGKYSSPNHPWQEDRGIGNSYGYNRAENIFDYDTKEKLIQTFSNVVGGGGNFLLCVGPTGDGRIPVIMQERLLQVGDWLKINGDAIYGSSANPFWPHQFNWGTATQKSGKLYLHVHDKNVGNLNIKGIDGTINNAVLLTKNGKLPVKFNLENQTLNLKWLSHLNNDAVTIIEIDIENPTYNSIARSRLDNTIEFNVQSMKIHGTKARANYQGYQDNLRILNWVDPTEYISSSFIVDYPGTYKIELTYASNEETNGGEFIINIDEQELEGKIASRENASFKKYVIGTLTLKKKGKHNISIKPKKDGIWNGFLLQSVKLSKIDQ